MVWGRILGSCAVVSGSVVSYLAVRRENKNGHFFPTTLAAPVIPVNDMLSGDHTNGYFQWNDNWDRRDPKMCQKKKKSSSDDDEIERPTATRRLFLIRHGQYNTGSATDEERTLTRLGHQQAELTANRLSEVGLKPSVIV